MARRRNRAAVVVLGDFGRSPRMQYHTLSLANTQAGLDVDVIAYSGSEPHPTITQNPRIHLHLMSSPIPQGLPRIIYLMVLPLKLLIQMLTLIWILVVRVPAPDFFLVQLYSVNPLAEDLHIICRAASCSLIEEDGKVCSDNPPSIPTFTVVRWACWFRKAAFIIDWHNFGYTILGMSLGATHPFVKLYSWYERRYGRMADGHLCVTKAMQQELEENWHIKATVLYDRAPSHFHLTSLEEKHELFCRLSLQTANSSPTRRDFGTEDNGKESTLFTCCTLISGGKLNSEDNSSVCKFWLKEERPALILSSTSWTADENFDMLLEAAVCYDRRVSALLGEDDSLDTVNASREPSTTGGPFPNLFIIVTGKGPLRDEYERKIQKLRLKRVTFRTMWVSAKDYPLLLGSADLGVCLHTSSSGLDLPMKVVDMFGCGLPVCAVSYSCINELVKDGENGLLFWSSSQLANQFLELFKGFPHECQLLSKLQSGAVTSGSSSRWADEWEKNVAPMIAKVGKTC